MSATRYLRKKEIDHLTGVATFSVPTLYLGMFTADPTELGSLANEVSGSGYARQSLAGVMGAADLTSGISINTTVINFGPASANWGTTVYLALLDALTGGNMLWPGALNQPRTITTGQPFQIPIGALRLRAT